MSAVKYITLPERMQATALQKLAWEVFQYQYFDAVLICAPSYHIPYLGTALALMLRNFHRPVILYHDVWQQSRAEDWARNCCPGVYALEGDVLYLACRTTFEPHTGITSPYHPLVGQMSGERFCIYQDRVPRVAAAEAMVCDAISEKIGLVRPGFAFAKAEELLGKDAYFVLLQNPSDVDWLLNGQREILDRLHKEQIPVVVHGLPPQITSPLLRRRILRSGVILTGDMTGEAALVKLSWTMARCSVPESVRLYFSLSFAGEMTQLRTYHF